MRAYISVRDCVKPLRSSYTGLYPQRDFRVHLSTSGPVIVNFTPPEKASQSCGSFRSRIAGSEEPAGLPQSITYPQYHDFQGLPKQTELELTETGSYLRLLDSCITQLKAQGPSGTCNESKEEEKKNGPRRACRRRGGLALISCKARNQMIFWTLRELKGSNRSSVD